jgi:hypothetical protein
MAYTPAPFNPSTPYQNQVATELNLANQNFTILSQAFLNNDPASKPILRASYIGTTAPSNPVAGTTWLDTSTTPPTFKVYDGSNWQSNVINATNAVNATNATNANNSNTVSGFSASQTPAPNTIPVSDNTGKLNDGWLNFVANDPKVKTALNASGAAPIYACRAWVNFNGNTNPPTIRASGNVSSIVVTNYTDFTINFATAMPDVNFVWSASGSAYYDFYDYYDFYGDVTYILKFGTWSKTTTSLKIYCAGYDLNYIDIIVIR